MSWIISYLDRSNLKCFLRCNLHDLYQSRKSGQESIKIPLRLDQLCEDDLVCIFRWLRPKNLVGIERVSKKFFHVVAKTFQSLKHISEQNVEHTEDYLVMDGEVVEPSFHAVSFINRFGPSLQTLPLALLLPQLETGEHFPNCDTNYFKQLAWRFPEVSDVGRLNDITIDWLLLFLRATRGKSKLRKLFIYFELKSYHLLDSATIEKFSKKLNAILSKCPRLDKLKLGLYTIVAPFLFVNGDKLLIEFGLLSVELCSRVRKLMLFDEAAYAIKEHLPRSPEPLEELKLMSNSPDYYTDEEVRQVCDFAPYLKKIKLIAEASVLKHLTVLHQLETIDFETPDNEYVPHPISQKQASESMKTFLKMVGKRLRKVWFCLLNPRHKMPITRWLSSYCPNVSDLRLVTAFDLKLSELRLPKMKHCDFFVLSAILESDIEVFFQNNPALTFVEFICEDPYCFERLWKYLSRTATSRHITHRLLVANIRRGDDVIRVI
ncbi:hypothetical protein HDE_09365 [Halotydeus destructor]|nr:hypothetical protein HDE_09365 [Halotydeus destructor]